MKPDETEAALGGEDFEISHAWMRAQPVRHALDGLPRGGLLECEFEGGRGLGARPG